ATGTYIVHPGGRSGALLRTVTSCFVTKHRQPPTTWLRARNRSRWCARPSGNRRPSFVNIDWHRDGPICCTYGAVERLVTLAPRFLTPLARNRCRAAQFSTAPHLHQATLV